MLKLVILNKLKPYKKLFVKAIQNVDFSFFCKNYFAVNKHYVQIVQEWVLEFWLMQVTNHNNLNIFLTAKGL